VLVVAHRFNAWCEAAFASAVRNVSPCCTGERLECTGDIAKWAVGKDGGENEGESSEQRAPAGIVGLILSEVAAAVDPDRPLSWHYGGGDKGKL